MAVVKVEFKDLREAVNAINESGLLAEKIKLVGEDKADILKKFMKVMADIPDNEEGKFPGPKVALDFYNSILDAEEKITQSKTGSEQTVEVNQTANDVNSLEKVSAPQTNEVIDQNKKEASKNRETKIVESNLKTTNSKKIEEKKIPCTTRIMMIVVDNPDISTEEIKAILHREKYTFSDNTLIMQKNDTLKTIKYIEAKNTKRTND